MDSNVDEGVCYAQPQTLAQRVAIANDFSQRFHYPVPLAVDGMANTADRIYAGWPERLYILDPSGTIVYKGGIGPFHYEPKEVRAWLEAHTAPPPASPSAEPTTAGTASD